MPDERPELSPAEWRLMKAVWRLGRPTVRQIHEAVEAETSWAPATVKTMLRRMETKGLLKTVPRRRAPAVHGGPGAPFVGVTLRGAFPRHGARRLPGPSRGLHRQVPGPEHRGTR